MRFAKGHGTQNDFVLVPDVDGALALTPELVRALCDRRAGIGADGVLRVVRSAKDADGAAMAADAEWFMDYRNADGSLAQTCGNGTRVYLRYLIEEGLADPAPGEVVPLATRGGVRSVRTAGGDRVTTDMGPATDLPGADLLTVSVGDRSWRAEGIAVPNPHAVVFVDDLAEAGDLRDAPVLAPPAAVPDGANVEFVLRRGPRHLAMRVHERGVGETRSCGTGAAAVAWAAMRRDGAVPGSTYRVDVPGGRLEVTWREDGSLDLTGPAVVVARGDVDPVSLLDSLA